jgi:tricorn protease-like protein
MLAVDTGEKRRLTSPPAQLSGDSTPAFSPDGRTLAFSRNVDVGAGDLYLLTFSDGLKPVGEAKRITFVVRRLVQHKTKKLHQQRLFRNFFRRISFDA